MKPYSPLIQSSFADAGLKTSELSDSIASLNRRQFFKLSGVAGGGLVLGLGMSAQVGAQAVAADGTVITPYVQILSNGRIKISSKNPECGQGIKTGLPLIIAEELDVRWEDVDVVQADIDASRYGLQLAGGSLSTPMNWIPMRQAGAAARMMILAAAAQQLYLPIAELRTSESKVIHVPTGEEYGYGEFAELAATMPVPDMGTISLKDPSEFTILGKRYSGVENQKVVTGAPLFGIDQKLPGIAYATYTKSPAIGGTASSFNEAHIKSLNGVIDAFIVDPVGSLFIPGLDGQGYLGGVAIVANSTWAAMKAKQELEVVWDTSTADTAASWSHLVENANRIADQDGAMELLNSGDVGAAFANASQVVEGFYEFPYHSHVNLEPQNCTGLYENGRMELWAPSQAPQNGAAGIAAITGIPAENIVINQTRIGGGFGRRLFSDFMYEVAAIARRMEGTPIKLQWTREDDMAYDFYRPGGFHSYKAAIDENGKMIGFTDHFITVSENAEAQAPVMAADLGTDVLPMQHVENVRVTQTLQPAAIPTGYMRAPGSNAYGFTFQSFLHEVAEAGGRDYRDFLMDLLDTEDLPPPPPQPGFPPAPAFSNSRARNVIASVTDRAEWGRAMPEGRALGLAFYYSHSGYVAQVADVSVNSRKEMTVHKIWSVADFGFIHNLSGAENQIQGSIMDGLSQLMYAKISFEGGIIEQNNLHQYPLLRMSKAPEIDAHFLQPMDVPPTGSGEPALPPTLPAIANAIYSASGVRVRKTPLSELGYTLV
ncbi:MAG: molybdopterin cofactor-binding domain-containing protein [Pseudohongiellaceae bacterium]